MILQTELYCSNCGLKKTLQNYISKGDSIQILCDSCEEQIITIKAYSGFVYFLTNPSMPQYIKIGCTGRNVISRVDELNRSTSVPTPFKIEMYFPSLDHYRDESTIHQALDSYRVNGKEFFEISIEEAINILETLPDLVNFRSIFESNKHLNRPECFGNSKHILVRDFPDKCKICQHKNPCDALVNKKSEEKERAKIEKLKSDGPSCFGKQLAYRDMPSKSAICKQCPYGVECYSYSWERTEI